MYIYIYLSIFIYMYIIIEYLKIYGTIKTNIYIYIYIFSTLGRGPSSLERTVLASNHSIRFFLIKIVLE